MFCLLRGEAFIINMLTPPSSSVEKKSDISTILVNDNIVDVWSH